ncbi:hypothetical protein [Bartonella bovis]|uniref:hypothetical protein n=1 Tax=Bartonella bovis TaxID=155194 RepID=UPI0003B47EE4|nr:hypothetical protein [Bartonella bovis]
MVKAITQCARLAFGVPNIYDENEADRINEVNHILQNESVPDEVLEQIKELIKQT